MFEHIRSAYGFKLTIIVIFVVVLTAGLSALAYHAGTLRATGEPFRETAESTLDGIELADSGRAVVTVNESRGEVCAGASVEDGAGVACTSLDAEDPMISITGGSDASGVTHLTVVDPRARLGTLLVEVEGFAYYLPSEDDGFSIDARLPSAPEVLTILDHDGAVIDVKHPQAAHDEARDGLLEQFETIDEPLHELQ